jgi:hypothetical protein
MSNYDPPQQPWGGPPQDPYGGAPQYPPPQQQPGGYPPPTQAFPPGGSGYPPVSGGGGYPPVSGGGYPPPADPYAGGYGQQDPYGQGGYGQTAYGQPAYGQPGYGQPTPPRRGGGAKIALIIAGVVLLALCGGGIFTAYKLTSDDNKTNGNNQANPSATAAPTGTGTGTGTRTAAPTNTATTDGGGGGSNPDNFRKGDCFVNDGTESDPEVRKVPCTTSGAYEVIAKVNFTTDEKRCDDRVLGAGAGNWNASYVMDKSPGSTGDYVLCLKKR